MSRKIVGPAEKEIQQKWLAGNSEWKDCHDLCGWEGNYVTWECCSVGAPWNHHQQYWLYRLCYPHPSHFLRGGAGYCNSLLEVEFFIAIPIFSERRLMRKESREEDFKKI